MNQFLCLGKIKFLLPSFPILTLLGRETQIKTIFWILLFKFYLNTESSQLSMLLYFPIFAHIVKCSACSHCLILQIKLHEIINKNYMKVHMQARLHTLKFKLVLLSVCILLKGLNFPWKLESIFKIFGQVVYKTLATEFNQSW